MRVAARMLIPKNINIERLNVLKNKNEYCSEKKSGTVLWKKSNLLESVSESSICQWKTSHFSYLGERLFKCKTITTVVVHL